MIISMHAHWPISEMVSRQKIRVPCDFRVFGQSIFLPSFNYQSIMTMVLNYSLILNKPQPHISLITFMSGIDGVVCEKQKPPNNNVSIGFSDHLSLSSVNMRLPPSLNQKKKPSVRLKNATSSIHN